MMTDQQALEAEMAAYKKDYVNMMAMYQHIIEVRVDNIVCRFVGVVCEDKVCTTLGMTSIQSITPILRHLMDMTNSERLEFISIGKEPIMGATWIKSHDEEGIKYSYYPAVKDGGKRNITKHGTHSMKIFTPRQLSWLIRNQFDVFGLIDNGMAERK